jgi:gliding motility-associated-like protein
MKINKRNMKINLLATTLLLTLSLSAQTLRLSFPEVFVDNGETVTLPLTVSDFDSIVSLQLSINWDTEIATYQSFSLDALPLLAIGDFQADQGELRLSWFDNTGNGRSLADGTVIANITFVAMGELGDFTPVDFTDTPLAVQIFKATAVAGEFDPVNLDPDNGRITIGGALGFSIENNDVSCFGANDGSATISLEANPDEYTINWSGPDGYMAEGLSQTGLTGGVYTIEIIANASGTSVFTYALTISAPEEELSLEALTVTESSCNEPSGSVTATAIGGTAPYAYALGNSTNADGVFENLAAGNYNLIVLDANDCSVLEMVEIIAPDAPEIVLPATSQLCDESEVLDPMAVGTYLWSTGETTATIEVDTPGTYSVTVTNAEDCSSSASVEVIEGSKPVAVIGNDFLETCPGDSLQLDVSGGDTYRWLFGIESLSADDVSNPLAFPDSTANYAVEVSNSCGADTLMFQLLVYDILATAGPDTCIGPGDEAQLMASGGIFYQWTENVYPLSDLTIANPVSSPEDSTTYQVQITDINGCVTTDEVTVLVANDPASSIIPYNLITPNGDGKNDVLEFGSIGKFGTNSLKVYNRWGDLVYQKVNYESDEDRFDGTLNGSRLPAGNYFYVLAFRAGDVKQTLTIIWE